MAHVDNLRRYFPAVRNVVYLDTASFGALPDAAINAMQDALNKQLQDGRLAETYHADGRTVHAEVRQELGHLFDTHGDHFALTDSAAQGLNVVLWGLHLAAGDEIIYTDASGADALLPLFVQKQRRGVVLRKVSGAMPMDDLLAAVKTNCSRHTRLVVVPHVSALTGHRLPVEKIAEIAHDAGAYCLVHGSHGAGAEPFTLRGSAIDFYAFAAHRWLCAPEGTGALYVNPSLLTVLDPTYVGEASMQASGHYTPSGYYLPAASAQKFEHAVNHGLHWLGLLHSLRFLRTQVGWDYAYSRIHGLSGYVMDHLLDYPHVRLLTPRDARAGLVAFQVDGVSATKVVEVARERGIDIQAVPERNAVRVSCGFYNTEDDVNRLLNVLQNGNDWM